MAKEDRDQWVVKCPKCGRIEGSCRHVSRGIRADHMPHGNENNRDNDVGRHAPKHKVSKHAIRA